MPSHQVSHLDCGLHECGLPNWREIYGSVKSLHLGSCVSDFNLKEVFIIFIIKKDPRKHFNIEWPQLWSYTKQRVSEILPTGVFQCRHYVCWCVWVCKCVCVRVSKVSIIPSQLSKCSTTFHSAKINELQSNKLRIPHKNFMNKIKLTVEASTNDLCMTEACPVYLVQYAVNFDRSVHFWHMSSQSSSGWILTAPIKL